MRHIRGFLGVAAATLLAGCVLLPAASVAQTAANTDQWIHVRVENKNDNGETVRVNVPIEMAVKVLPAINHDQLHNGKVRLDHCHMDDVDLHALLDAVRSSKDGEYVTVQSNENNVRVAKNAGYLYIHVTDKKGTTKAGKESRVEVKVPMKVVDALFSAGKDELDVVAALRALSANGDTELVSVKDDENTVHIWIDSKNVSD
jgi:hypothetical protein